MVVTTVLPGNCKPDDDASIGALCLYAADETTVVSVTVPPTPRNDRRLYKSKLASSAMLIPGGSQYVLHCVEANSDPARPRSVRFSNSG